MQRQVIRCRQGHLTVVEQGRRICIKCRERGDPIQDDQGRTTFPFKQASRLVARLEDEARRPKQEVPSV